MRFANLAVLLVVACAGSAGNVRGTGGSGPTFTEPCEDRKPGLSKCGVVYTPETVDGGKVTKWRCWSACYVAKKKDDPKYDGGTDGSVVYAHATDKPACKTDLEAQAARGCKP